MAYALDENERDEEELKSNEQGQALGAESGIITGEQARAAQGQVGTGQFTNLQSYLDQNDSEKFGNQFTGRVKESVDAAGTQQEAAGNTFRQKADESAVKEDPTLIKTAVETPETVVSNPEQYSAFTKMRDAEYKGPQNLNDLEEEYTKASSATRGAVEDTEQTKSTSGQQALLGKYYGADAGRYDYSAGQKNLDQLLIGMNPGTRSALQAQQQQAQEMQGKFGELENSLSGYAKARKEETERAKANTVGAVTGATNQTKEQIQKNYEDQLAKYQQTQNAVQAGLREKALDPEYLRKVGVDEGQRVYDLDLTKYYQPGTTPTIHNTATKQDYDRYSALSKLLEQPNTLLTDESQVGTYDSNNSYTFDRDRFYNDVKAKEALYNAELNRRDFSGMGGTTQGGNTTPWSQMIKDSFGDSFGNISPFSNDIGGNIAGGGEIADSGPATVRNQGKPLSLADKLENIRWQKEQTYSNWNPEHRAQADKEWHDKGGPVIEKKYNDLLSALQNYFNYNNVLKQK